MFCVAHSHFNTHRVYPSWVYTSRNTTISRATSATVYCNCIHTYVCQLSFVFSTVPIQSHFLCSCSLFSLFATQTWPLLCSTTKNLHLVSINKFERSRFYPPFQTKGKINHNKRTLHQTIAEWKWNEMNLKFCTLLNGKLYGTICVQLDGFSNFS